jgi:hypothetical protein
MEAWVERGGGKIVGERRERKDEEICQEKQLFKREESVGKEKAIAAGEVRARRAQR